MLAVKLPMSSSHWFPLPGSKWPFWVLPNEPRHGSLSLASARESRERAAGCSYLESKSTVRDNIDNAPEMVMMDTNTCRSNEPLDVASADFYPFHDESATIKLLATPQSSINAQVYLESSSTFKSTAPLAGLDQKYTSIPEYLLKLISNYSLRRLLIRVGDIASTSTPETNAIFHDNNDDAEQLLREERARGPSGTSILASFENDKLQSIDDFKNKYASLLRYLLDNNLFPPCGAPLDSIRVKKHGYSTIVHHPQTHLSNFIEVESFLAADAATFCKNGIQALLLSKGTKAAEGGWGAATNNVACHPQENWGLFDSLFSSPSATTSSLSSTALSDLLLRSSSELLFQSTLNNRHSVWIELDVSNSCYNSGSDPKDNEECLIRVTRGASYGIGLPHPTLQKASSGEPGRVINLSLGDLILGNNRDELKTWNPCPLSDSSKVSLYTPTGLESKVASLGAGLISSVISGMKYDFNAMMSENVYFDLNSPLTQLYQLDEEKSVGKASSPLFGISRTVQRHLGLASGTIVSVFRYGDIAPEDLHSSVKVEAFDTLPGGLIKPTIHTLRMVLYEGGGAGNDRFTPPLNGDCSSSRSDSVRCSKVMLYDLQKLNLHLNSDGTWLIERTVVLNPDSSLWMMVDFDEAYVPFQKFPADANRGIDAHPSRAKFLFSTEAATPITLYSSSLLLLPPVPDMSMPFNVISLSCTLWAFVLGSLMNILVRRATESVKSDFTGEKEKRPIDKIKEKLKHKISRTKQVFRKS